MIYKENNTTVNARAQFGFGEPTANQSKAKERKIRLDLNNEELGKHNIA